MPQNTSAAVRARRVEPADSLDYFPTPPWATRALVEAVLRPLGLWRRDALVWEPAAGEGHMARPLAEYFDRVVASDIHDYGLGDPVFDFLALEPGRNAAPPDFLEGSPDWIITNPPFGPAADPRVVRFTLAALAHARAGVAMFARVQVLEGGDRYQRLWRPFHERLIWCQFAERVPIARGRVSEESAATATGWLVATAEPRFPPLDAGGLVAVPTLIIPPGQRKRLERDGDYGPATAFAPRQGALFSRGGAAELIIQR
jgi:hypothetical protein